MTRDDQDELRAILALPLVGALQSQRSHAGYDKLSPSPDCAPDSPEPQDIPVPGAPAPASAKGDAA